MSTLQEPPCSCSDGSDAVSTAHCPSVGNSSAHFQVLTEYCLKCTYVLNLGRFHGRPQLHVTVAHLLEEVV
jgi:hypothetical protein